MQLLTKEVLSKLPKFGSTDDKEPDQIKVVVKFFTPWSIWTWYAIEGSYFDADGYFDSDKLKVDFLFYGWVEGFFSELGSFRLSELESLRGPFGLRVECDLYYTPQTLQELMDNAFPFVGYKVAVGAHGINDTNQSWQLPDTIKGCKETNTHQST